MTDYGPSITLARLYERVSAKGNHYLVGRIGLVKVAILKSGEVSEAGHPIWNVVLQQAPAAPTQSEDAEVGQTEAKSQHRGARRKPRRRKPQEEHDTGNVAPINGKPDDEVPDFVGDAG
jgi:hypothetical protein